MKTIRRIVIEPGAGGYSLELALRDKEGYAVYHLTDNKDLLAWLTMYLANEYESPLPPSGSA